MNHDRNDDRVVILKRSAPRAIEWTAERIADGGVVALPTDTVYGLACSLAHPEALRRIYEIKGRNLSAPLPVLVSSSIAVEHLVHDISHDVGLLLDLFWPGPLTIVLPAKAGMPDEVTAGTGTVGLRMPNHPLTIEVIERAGGAIACTSANRSGESPGITAEDVRSTIGPDLDLILDGGAAPGGVPSTVIAIKGDDLRLIREGAIAFAVVDAAWNELLAAHVHE